MSRGSSKVAIARLLKHDEHLAKEKEFTRLRDQLSQQRRDLPWERVDKECIFEGPDGPESLSKLFVGKSQLIVYSILKQLVLACSTRTRTG